jgi:hypothetical protein
MTSPCAVRKCGTCTRKKSRRIATVPLPEFLRTTALPASWTQSYRSAIRGARLATRASMAPDSMLPATAEKSGPHEEGRTGGDQYCGAASQNRPAVAMKIL